MPCKAIGAVVMAGQIGASSRGGGEQGNWAGGGSGGEQGAIGGPSEVDHVVVELCGPVFGKLHERQPSERGSHARARMEAPPLALG